MSSRTPSPSPSLMSIMCPGYKPVAPTSSYMGTPISTPVMRHMDSEQHLHPLSSTQQQYRSSGVFSGSTLSLSSPTVEEDIGETPLLADTSVSLSSPEAVTVSSPIDVVLQDGSQPCVEQETFTFRRVFSDTSAPKSFPISARPLSVDSIVDMMSTVDSVVSSQSVHTVSSIDSDATLTPSRPLSRLSPDGLSSPCDEP